MAKKEREPGKPGSRLFLVFLYYPERAGRSVVEFAGVFFHVEENPVEVRMELMEVVKDRTDTTLVMRPAIDRRLGSHATRGCQDTEHANTEE